MAVTLVMRTMATVSAFAALVAVASFTVSAFRALVSARAPNVFELRRFGFRSRSISGRGFAGFRRCGFDGSLSDRRDSFCLDRGGRRRFCRRSFCRLRGRRWRVDVFSGLRSGRCAACRRFVRRRTRRCKPVPATDEATASGATPGPEAAENVDAPSATSETTEAPAAETAAPAAVEAEAVAPVGEASVEAAPAEAGEAASTDAAAPEPEAPKLEDIGARADTSARNAETVNDATATSAAKADTVAIVRITRVTAISSRQPPARLHPTMPPRR